MYLYILYLQSEILRDLNIVIMWNKKCSTQNSWSVDNQVSTHTTGIYFFVKEQYFAFYNYHSSAFQMNLATVLKKGKKKKKNNKPLKLKMFSKTILKN